MADEKDDAIDNPETRQYTDVGLRQHDERRVQTDEGIEKPQGTFVGETGPRYEATDIPLKPIFVTAAIVIGMTIASYILLYAMYSGWDRFYADRNDKLAMQPGPNEQVPRNVPVLQPMPNNLSKSETGDFVDYQRDFATRMAAMPIDQAIEEVAAKGLPTGPEWQMAPGTVMVNGVVMSAADAARQQEALRAYAQRQGMDMNASATPPVATAPPAAAPAVAAPAPASKAAAAAAGAPR